MAVVIITAAKEEVGEMWRFTLKHFMMLDGGEQAQCYK